MVNLESIVVLCRLGMVVEVDSAASCRYSTYFYIIDPREEIVMLLLSQLLPTHSYPVRCKLRVAINSAVITDKPTSMSCIGGAATVDIAARL